MRLLIESSSRKRGSDSRVRGNDRTNASCWRDAKRYLVGGVNSPVRSFKAVGGSPIFADRGRGAYLWDVEGHKLIDYVLSWGALIVGHRHPTVIQAVSKALRRGTTFGTPTPLETELAKAITQAFPSMEQVRFVTSGTEAAMSAIRLARAAAAIGSGTTNPSWRAATGRRKILKFEGGYHGHFDPLLTKAGSGMMTLGLPASPGVPESVTQDTITLPFNDTEALRRAVQRFSSELACVLVEPVLANVGVIPPERGFLQTLRRMTREKRILLIFDEVITGFRVAYGGAQTLYGIKPDLTILGKAIGGGFPIGAYGGPRKLMGLVAPAGPVYQAGTLAGHPVAMAAGLATLQVLRRPGTYERLSEQAANLRKGLLRVGQKHGIALTAHQVGALLSLFFSEGPIRNSADAKRASSSRYARYFRGMLARGIYLPPSAYEGWFLSTAHGDVEIEKTLKAHAVAISELRTRNSKLPNG